MRGRAPPRPRPSRRRAGEPTGITFLRPVVRRAIPSSSRSSSSGSIRTFESEPMQIARPRAQSALTGREAVSQVRLGRRAEADAGAGVGEQVELGGAFACVAWTTVVSGPRQPDRASSSIGRSPCSARHSSTSRGCSSAWTCSGSCLGGGVAADLLEPVGRAGADGVGGEADADAVACGATRPGRGTRRPTPGGTAAGRPARTRRGAGRARFRPRRRPRRPRAPPRRPR